MVCPGSGDAFEGCRQEPVSNRSDLPWPVIPGQRVSVHRQPRRVVIPPGTRNGSTMNLHGPDEVIASVPYLLGFHPNESLVLMWLVDGGLAMTQRLDLDGLPQSIDAADALLAPGIRIGASQVVVLLYTSTEPAPMAWITRFADHGIDVVDIVRTSGDRWWSLLCTQECCPPAGRVIDPQMKEKVAARFVLDGQVAYADRSELVREIEPDPIAVAASLRALEAMPAQSPNALAATCLRQWSRVERQRHRRIRARVCATHIIALRHIATRDYLGWHLAQRERDSLLATCWLMRTVLRGAPVGDVAPIGTMAGIAHWLAGDGARASVCLDRALADDPQYVLAQLIARSIQAGLPPGEWRALLRSLPVNALSA